MNDQQQFESETQEEAHYWFTVSDFADLSLKHGLDKMIVDMLQCRDKLRKEQQSG